MAEATVKKSSENRCKILSWNTIAFWTWNIETKECNICRNHIMNSCVECINSKNKAVNESCKVVTGKCGCSFHYHCINNWSKSNSKCPYHTTVEWEFNIVGFEKDI